MDTQHLKKFCPVCKLPNDRDVLICQHCGASMDLNAGAPTTRRVSDEFELTEEIKEQVSREHTPPSRGISIFLLNSGEPFAVRTDDEFVLGRRSETIAEPIVDLTDLDGFTQGVSRRHALVRVVGDKYVVIDLNSSNGTWLNGQRLVPTRPYDMPSGAVLQLGRMKLIVSYLRPPQAKK